MLKESINLLTKFVDELNDLQSKDGNLNVSVSELKDKLTKTIKEWKIENSFRSGFTVICNKCGSQDVNFSCNEDVDYSQIFIDCSNCNNEEERMV